MGKRYYYAELSGTPYEIGYQHGSKAKDQVLNSIETYKTMFWERAHVEWEDAKLNSRKYIPYIKEYDADLLEEMQGVADGAGLTLEDILAINARSEVLMTMTGGKKKELDGCTNIAVSPERTKEGNTLLAHNWDWKASQQASIVTFKIHQIDKPDILMITEAGIIGKFGVNEYGVGVAMNALTTPSDANGVPLHCILRGILNSKTLGLAIKAINAYPNACAANYMMAEGCGEVFDCEKAPQDYDILYPSDCVLVHANHFTSPKLKVKIPDNIITLSHTSFLRYNRVGKLIRQHEKIGVEDLKAALRDHAEYPGSICSHGETSETIFTMILDLTNKTMEVCCGQPCCGEFYKLSL